MNPLELLPQPEAPRPRAARAYAGASMTRLTGDWVAGSTSADSEIVQGLRTLRNRARELERNNEYAKNVVRLFKNNVVGEGIRFQSQVMMRRGGRLDAKTNDLIERKFLRWCRKDTCDVAGRLSFFDLQRMAVGALPTSGEILVRQIRRPFGRGNKIPFALEIMESDQLVDNYSTGKGDNGNRVKMGVEIDEWSRPTAYFAYPYHPGDFAFAAQAPSNRWMRIPAGEILHLFVSDRPGQTRGVPEFHTALRRLNNMGAYEEAEIVAARASACIMGFIQSQDADPVGVEAVQDGQRVTNLAAGEIKQLAPGEVFQGFSPSRPNPAMEGFMRFMLRGMCAGTGISYASASGDYSQSNYSSSRLGLLTERDQWKVLQDWLVENLCRPVFEAWLEAAVLAGELDLPGYWDDPTPFLECRWLTRGWAYIDPLKEAMADKIRVRSCMTTLADVVAAQGGDFEDVFTQRRRELDLAADLELVMDTDPAQVNDKGQVQGAQALDANAETVADEPTDPTSQAVQDDSGDAQGSGGRSASIQALRRAYRRALRQEERDDILETIALLEALVDEPAASSSTALVSRQ